MNDLDLCLEVVSRSCQPLRHIRRWISRKPSEIEAWLGSKGLPIGNGTWVSNDRVTDDVTWTQRCCEAVRSAILATAWLRVNTDVATWRQPHVEQVGRFSQVSVSDWRSKSWACHRAARYHIAVTMLYRMQLHCIFKRHTHGSQLNQYQKPTAIQRGYPLLLEF